MLEKIFGKKSTGVVYILCAAFLLLMLAGSAVLYFTREGGSLFTLVGYAAYTAIELVLISLPVFVQKKWRLYIPPAIEIGICLYAVLFLTGSLYYDPKTDIQVSVTPFVGGFVFAMTVFSILYSVSSLRAEKKSRRPSPLRVSVMTFFATELLVAVFYLTIYLIGLAVRAVTPGDITEFLTYSTAHQGGNFVFCVIGYFTARSRRAERYKIRSFKDADAAELDALKEKDRTQYTVIKNISEDDTDYRKLMRRAKANFFVGRIVYLAVYAVYLVHTCITFASRGRLGILIIVCLAAGFALTALVYVYEYYLFRKGSPNQRLRRLKIGKQTRAMRRCLPFSPPEWRYSISAFCFTICSENPANIHPSEIRHRRQRAGKTKKRLCFRSIQRKQRELPLCRAEFQTAVQSAIRTMRTALRAAMRTAVLATLRNPLFYFDRTRNFRERKRIKLKTAEAFLPPPFFHR